MSTTSRSRTPTWSDKVARRPPSGCARSPSTSTGAARSCAADRGIIIADTKIELGWAPDGTLVLADELLTSDSSRFWPAE